MVCAVRRGGKMGGDGGEGRKGGGDGRGGEREGEKEGEGRGKARGVELRKGGMGRGDKKGRLEERMEVREREGGEGRGRTADACMCSSLSKTTESTTFDLSSFCCYIPQVLVQG